MSNGKAYYNENNLFAANHLRYLIEENMICPGDVDSRSIKEVRAADLKGYTQCHFFAGIGVWSYALRIAGWPDDRPVWTGSCPCQPFSNAGEKKGLKDERHLWPDWFSLIQELRPIEIFGEQVASQTIKTWFDLVSDDLERVGYTIGAAITAACGFGSPQPRKRLYFVGHTKRKGLPRSIQNSGVSSFSEEAQSERSNEIFRAWRQMATSPTSVPHIDGTPLWLARELLKGYGNALCAPQAQAFIESYLEIESENL